MAEVNRQVFALEYPSKEGFFGQATKTLGEGLG
jgi:hypothetical protein